MYRKIATILLFSIAFTISAFAEMINIGVPHIQNFKRKEYRGGTQNWAVAQDQRGFMYFANNEGLLRFDGVNWKIYKMPNLSIVRSVYIDKSGQIYVGAYNELGKMVIGKNGTTEFYSLKKYLPKDYLNFDDVWNITSFQNQIVYQSYNFAFLFKNDSTVSIIKAPSRFQNSYEVNGRLFFNDQEKGLMEYKDDNLVPMSGFEALKGEEIWSIIPFNRSNDLMICTLNKGTYVYNGQSLKEWQVPLNTLL